MSHIPPLLSSTPPPIDLEDLPNNDSVAPPIIEDEFGDFAVAMETDDIPDSLSVPETPVHQESRSSTSATGYVDHLPLFNYIEFPESSIISSPNRKSEEDITIAPSYEDETTQEHESYPEQRSSHLEVDEKRQLTSNSEDVLDLRSNEKKLEHDNDDDHHDDCYSDLSFLNTSQNSVVDNVYSEDEEEIEIKFDDNTSLPSLKFDSLSINSKRSSTPNDIVGSTSNLDQSIGESQSEKAISTNSNVNQPKNMKENIPSEEDFQTPNENKNLEIDEENLNSNVTTEMTSREENFTFEADFSQFASFEATGDINESSGTVKIEMSGNENPPIDDDFNDFQDFSAAEMTAGDITKSEVPLNDDKDDEFDDFDIVEDGALKFPSPTNSNSMNLVEKLKIILTTMFPFDEKDNSFDQQNHSSESTCNSNNIPATTLNQIDSAKALDYQWVYSEIRHALIKSLGVDSRNILYGEKWNTFMPRYAANLSFNPLEPIKSDCNTKNQASVKKTDVPAVEFDWDSAGLVNPLDASQAYTLLLELDQLVVVADKINLDSYSCSSSPCSTKTTSKMPSSITNLNGVEMYPSPATSMAIINRNFDDGDDVENSCSFNVPSIHTTINEFHKRTDANLTYPTTKTNNNNNNNYYNNDDMIYKNNNCTIENTNINDIFANQNGSNMDCRTKEILYDKSVETIYASQSRNINEPIDEQQPTISDAITIDDYNRPQTFSDQSSAIDATMVVANITVTAKTTTATIATATTTTTTTTTATTHRIPSPTSNKTSNAFADGINQKIIGNHSSIQRLEPENDGGNVVITSTYAGPLKETHIYTPSTKNDCCASELPTKNSECNNLEPIDFDYEMAAAGIIIDEKVVKKEYRDVEYNPKFELSLDISDTGLEAPNKDNELKCDELKKSSVSISTTKSNQHSTSNANAAAEVDDEFSDFQSVPVFENESSFYSFSSKQTKINSINIDKSRSVTTGSTPRTQTPISMIADEMILSPAVLLPQSIQIESKPKIEWPSPGINPEELARIEELFPQPKTTRLSLSSSQQNGHTNLTTTSLKNSNSKMLSPILSHSHNIQNSSLTISEKVANQTTNDDEDWSEFMSVPAALNSFSTISPLPRQNPSTSQFGYRHKKSPPEHNQGKRQSTSSKSSFSNDEEWSDFVSSAPAASKEAVRSLYKNPYYNQQNYIKNVMPNFTKKKTVINTIQHI